MSAFLGIVFHESSEAKRTLGSGGLWTQVLPRLACRFSQLKSCTSHQAVASMVTLLLLDSDQLTSVKSINWKRTTAAWCTEIFNCIQFISESEAFCPFSSNSWGRAPCIWLDYTFCSHSRAGYTAQLPSPQSLLCTSIKFSWRVFDNLYSILKPLRK